MYRRIDPFISASRGTLAGDLLYWLHLSDHHRDDRLSEQALPFLVARPFLGPIRRTPGRVPGGPKLSLLGRPRGLGPGD